MGEPLQRRRAPVLWITLAVAICCLAGFAAWQIARKREASAGAHDPPRWIVAQSRMVTNKVNATGILRLKTGAEVRVGAQLSGIVRRLYVTVGSSVVQGETIAEIDSRPIEAKVKQALTQLTQAEVTLAKANLDFTRSRELFDAGVISKQQFDDANATLRAATASEAAAKSSVEEASVDLAYVAIRAPISGTVASVSTQQGETVAASFATPTFVTIIQKNALEIVAMVDEADIGNVRPGESAGFITETWPDREFTGTVLRVAPVATIISGVVNYEVAISIRRDVELLKPDMTANVNIVTSQHRALVIPADCVHRDEDGSFVQLRSAAGPPVKQRITVGNRTGKEVEVTGGLAPEQQVLEQKEGAANS